MNPESILNLLLGAGGGGGIAGIYSIVRAKARGKLDDEETLIKRLNDDNKDKDQQIDRMEKRDGRLRRQREIAWAQAARFRRRLIALGEDDDALEELVNFDD
jgi:hypothetical protein